MKKNIHRISVRYNKSSFVNSRKEAQKAWNNLKNRETEYANNVADLITFYDDLIKVCNEHLKFYEGE